MTSYTQYQLSNPTPAQLDITKQLMQKYSFSMTFDQGYRILTLVTNDTNLITLIDSKSIPNIVKSTITVPEYDDTKTVADVETLIQTNGDLTNIRPELITQAQTQISSTQKI